MDLVEELFLLTPKGKEALASPASKLEPKVKLVLALIERGAHDAEALQQRSKAALNDVTEALRLLVRSGFVATATIPCVKSAPAQIQAAPSATAGADKQLILKPGISPSQARFTLANFCLDEFGAEGQDMGEVIELCTDVSGLQRTVNDIRLKLEKRPDRIPALIACVKEINDTDF
jgi:hypothetical protein